MTQIDIWKLTTKAVAVLPSLQQRGSLLQPDIPVGNLSG